MDENEISEESLTRWLTEVVITEAQRLRDKGHNGAEIQRTFGNVMIVGGVSTLFHLADVKEPETIADTSTAAIVMVRRAIRKLWEPEASL